MCGGELRLGAVGVVEDISRTVDIGIHHWGKSVEKIGVKWLGKGRQKDEGGGCASLGTLLPFPNEIDPTGSSSKRGETWR